MAVLSTSTMNDVRKLLLELNGTFLTASMMVYMLPNAFLACSFILSDSEGAGDSRADLLC